MTQTEFLTGRAPERYKELLDPLVDLRLSDMQETLTELRGKADLMDKSSQEYDVVKARYKKIEKAITFWVGLKYEGIVIQDT